MQEETLTSREAAAALGVHVQTVNRWCRAGRIPAAYYRAGSRRLGWRVPASLIILLAQGAYPVAGGGLQLPLSAAVGADDART